MLPNERVAAMLVVYIESSNLTADCITKQLEEVKKQALKLAGLTHYLVAKTQRSLNIGMQLHPLI